MSKLIFESYSQIKKHLDSLSFSDLFVLVDSNTNRHCYPLIADYLPQHKLIMVEAGEVHKTLESCSFIWKELSEHNADRHSILVNLGGGVITDMGGFCASTYKRGIQFINIPTTLLSQVDASAGGKTGIDFLAYKNQIGVFSEPEFVLIDNQFHQTLTDRDLRSGFAEMLKHGLIRDKNHWDQLISIGYKNVTKELIQQSVSIKQTVVEEDPKEKGVRKILNFGHTVGHAIESFFLHTEEELLHGEAIAQGMLIEAYIAVELNLLTQKEYEEIKSVIGKIYGEIKIKKASRADILRLCKQDKKNETGEIRMSLLDRIGQANYNQAIELQLLEKALDTYL